jgi:ketosteroid isomerase-like protein
MAATDTRVADLEEIRALTHRYGLALDTFDLDGIVGVFAPDATFDCTAFGLEICEGEERIRAFFAHNQQVMANQIHMFSNHIIEFDGPDEAHGTNYLEQDGYTHAGQRIQCLGLNRDRYERTEQGWRITHRVITPLVPFHLEGYDE